MSKISHKSQLCVELKTETETDKQANSPSSTQSNSDSDSANASQPLDNLQFGLDLDIFGRFPLKRQKKQKKPVYHYHSAQQLSQFDFVPKEVWLQLCTVPMTVRHLDNQYSLMTPEAQDLPFTIRTRRLIWPHRLQQNEFQYSLRDLSTWVWAIIICHGGRFAAAIYHGNEMTHHKTLRRYCVRKKQGKRQINHLNSTNGRSGTAGGYKRAWNENKLLLEIREILCEWQTCLHSKCDRIFLHCPGSVNEHAVYGSSEEQQYLYPRSGTSGMLNDKLSEKRLKDVINKNQNKNTNLYRLKRKDERIAQIPVNTHSVTLREVERVHYWLSTCWIKQ